MKEYKIVRKPEGKEIPWEQIPTLKIDQVAWNMPAPGIESWAQLCYDESGLYVKLSTKEKDILAVGTQPLEYPNFDSCLEFFFSPMEGDNRYFNLEINPNCLMFQGLGHGVEDLIRFLPINPNIHPTAERTEDGWNVVYKVTKEYITEFFPEFTFTSGRVIRANFYKCGDNCVVPHYYSWNPMTIETPNFHYTPDFGKLILE